MVIGAVVLFIGATGVFIEMQDSLNYVWSVKAKPKKRLVAFSNKQAFVFFAADFIWFCLPRVNGNKLGP